MAMKPAGKAIVAALVVLGAISAAHFGGVFDKLKKQGETVQATQPSETIAPIERPLAAQPEPVAVAPAPAPTPIPQPVNSPLRQADALDQLIRQSGTK